MNRIDVRLAGLLKGRRCFSRYKTNSTHTKPAHEPKSSGFKGLPWLFIALVCFGYSAQAQDFSDDFSRGTDPGPLTPWVAQTGTWTVTGGVIQGGLNPLFSYGSAYVTNSWSSYSVQTRVQ